MMKAVSGLLVLLSVVAAAHCSNVAECKSDSDCKQGQCCVYVMGKYATTSCQTLGKPQDTCRPDAGPAAFTVSYPGSTPIPVKAHYMTCPCASGLTCQQGECAPGLPQGSEDHPAQVPRHY